MMRYASMLMLVAFQAAEPYAELLPNGSECSESSQCASGCCVWNPFANEVCDDDKWYRRCMEEDHTFSEGRADTCGAGSEDGKVLIMSYNLYLILLASDGPLSLDDRAARISEWFAQSPGKEYDVVLFQEAWISPETIRDGMTAAGYCSYIYDNRGSLGSGMAIYSKHPIDYHDFRGYQNACGGADCAVDKGVIYARIKKGAKMINVFGTHTMFAVENHDVRRRQYEAMRTFIDEQNIADEMVLLAGDFNEDKVHTPQLYDNMLSDLNAGEIQTDSNSTSYSYDPQENSLIDPESPGAGSIKRALDFIFYDKSASIAPGQDSTCRYIKPKDPDGNDLSDHYPASCEIIYSGAQTRTRISSVENSASLKTQCISASLFAWSVAFSGLI